MPTDFSAEQDTQFESDLNRARGYKPVTAKEMKQGYSQYKKQGLKFGQVKKSATDEELYQRAEHIVLAWWRQQQKEKSKNKKGKGAAPRDPLKGISSAWAGGNYSGGGTGVSSGASGGLPDTAMAAPGQGESGGPSDLPPITEKLNPTQVKQELRRLGVSDQWSPPSFATRSTQTLERWVNREAERRNLILRERGLRAYYDNGVVAQVARQVGFPINPNSVPKKYRQSHAEIRHYLLNLKRKWERSQQARIDNGEDSATVKRTSAAYLSKIRNAPNG